MAIFSMTSIDFSWWKRSGRSLSYLPSSDVFFWNFCCRFGSYHEAPIIKILILKDWLTHQVGYRIHTAQGAIQPVELCLGPFFFCEMRIYRFASSFSKFPCCKISTTYHNFYCQMNRKNQYRGNVNCQYGIWFCQSNFLETVCFYFVCNNALKWKSFLCSRVLQKTFSHFWHCNKAFHQVFGGQFLCW